MSLNFTQFYTRQFKMTAIFELSTTRAALRRCYTVTRCIHTLAASPSLCLSSVITHIFVSLVTYCMTVGQINHVTMMSPQVLRLGNQSVSGISYVTNPWPTARRQLREYSDKARLDEERIWVLFQAVA
jgi:hypothetical protein